MAINVGELIEISEDLVQERSTVDGVREQIRQHMDPDGHTFIGTETEGTSNRIEVIDPTGEQAGNLAASALHSSLTNPGSVFFEFQGIEGKPKLTTEEMNWLSTASSTCHDMFDSGRAGFSLSQQAKWRNGVFYGMGVTFTKEVPGIGAEFQSVPLHETYVRTGPDGRVNEVWRIFELTAAQAVIEYPEGAGPLVVKAAGNEKTKSDKTKFIHISRPRMSIKVNSGPRSFATESLHINADEKLLIRESGFPEWPWSTPRFTNRPGERYGRGPGWTALPAVKMLHRMATAWIESAELRARPALITPDDGVQGIPALFPAALNYARADLFRFGDPIRTIKNGGDTGIAIDLVQRWRETVEDIFMNRLLTLSDDPRMSATQVVKLDQKAENILSPIIGVFEVEDLNPMIERVLNIGIRAGKIAPAPESIDGQIKVVFTSPIARGRKMAEAGAILKTYEMVSPIAVVQPDVYANFDHNVAARHIAMINGTPPGFMLDEKEVEKDQEAARVAEAEAANTEQMIDAAGSAGPILKAIDGGKDARAS